MSKVMPARPLLKAILAVTSALALATASGCTSDDEVSVPGFAQFHVDEMELIVNEGDLFEISKVRGHPVYLAEFSSNDHQQRALERMLRFVESDVDHGRIVALEEVLASTMSEEPTAGYDLDLVNIARFFRVASAQRTPLDPMEERIREVCIDLGLLVRDEGRLHAEQTAALVSIAGGLDERYGEGTDAWIRDHEFRHGFYYTTLRPGVHEIWRRNLSDAERALIVRAIRMTSPYDPDNESLVEREFYSMVFEERFEEDLRVLARLDLGDESGPDREDVEALLEKLPEIRSQLSALEARELGE